MFIQSIKTKTKTYNSIVQTITQKSLSVASGLLKKLMKTGVLQNAASYSFNNWNIAKCYSFMALIAALFFAGCQKEKLNDVAINTTSSGSSAEAKLGWPFWHKDPVNTSYGALIGVPEEADDEDFQLNVGDQLGISCLRERVAVPCKSLDADMVPELNTSYKVLLNFNSPNNTGDDLLPFVSDLTQYQIDLNNILNTFTVMPVVAVIENEESNRFYYSGYANEYIDQLSAAISVMHARDIKVANGGITSTGLCYLVYEDFLNQGKEDSAEEFKQLANVTPNSPFTQDRGAFVDTLLNAYTNMNLDFVNFHWKATSPDTQTLIEVINYLKKRTGKKVISNELGQFDTDPNTLTSHVQECTDQSFPYIIWYSPDESYGKRGTPLQYMDASLTPTGIAYQDYLAN